MVPCISGICHISQLIGDFVQILGSKFWALGGLNEQESLANANVKRALSAAAGGYMRDEGWE